MNTWVVQYEGHSIRVENSVIRERLFVDDELQDEFFGFGHRSRLYGKIRGGAESDKQIRVSLGGWFIMQCRVFVDDRLVFHSNPDRAATAAVMANNSK